ncbi:MAG: transcriptional regulator [Betaproteobacteria bacterium]|nr:MAG: transcriptional regulator [Betaproteobacteria bacterium]
MPRSDAGHAHKVARSEKADLLKRLKRIGGQVEGISRMIAEDRYCIDIVTQIAAARSALDALGLKLLHDHAHGCVQQAVRSGSGDAAIEELMKVVQRFAR